MPADHELRDTVSDEELAERARSGSAEAEEILIKRYYRTVRACARPYFLVGGDAKDLIQEGLLGLLSAVRDYRSDRATAFKTYAQICIKRRIISAIRSDSRYKNLPLNKAVSYPPLSFECDECILQQSVQDPEEVLIGREQADERTSQLKKELSGLEEKVLDLYLDGYSCSEIASHLGKEPKAVDNAIQRVRRKALRIFDKATTA